MSHYVSSCLIKPHHVSSCLIMSHHVSVILIMSHHVSLCLMSHHVSVFLIMSHHVSLCLMSHHVSVILIMSHHVASSLIRSHHVSSCLTMSHHASSHYVSSCLIISHDNVSHVIISIFNVSHHILCGLLLSHPFNRTYFLLIICHTFPQSFQWKTTTPLNSFCPTPARILKFCLFLRSRRAHKLLYEQRQQLQLLRGHEGRLLSSTVKAYRCAYVFCVYHCVSLFFSIPLEYCNQLRAPGVLLLWLEMLQAIAVDYLVCHRCDELHKVFPPGAPKGSEAPQALVTWLLMALAQLWVHTFFNSIRLEHFGYVRIQCEVVEMEDQDKESLHATQRFNTCSHTHTHNLQSLDECHDKAFSRHFQNLKSSSSSNCTSSLKKSGYLAPALNAKDWIVQTDLLDWIYEVLSCVSQILHFEDLANRARGFMRPDWLFVPILCCKA